MAAAALTYDDDRLPWLEPYHDPAWARGQRIRATKWIGGVAVLAALLAAAYLYGSGEAAPDAPSVVAVIAPIEPSPVAQPVTVDQTPPIAPEPTGEAIAANAQPGQSIAPEPIQARRRATGPPGQVVQLGAFRKASTADRAYRAYVARYPLLRTMPRNVMAVTNESGTRTLYVLRLGTASRQQSGIVCRNLRASGDQCLVVG